MKIVDLNLLVYAINKETPFHEKALAWWEACLSDTETVGLAWVVIIGFIRLTTNPRVISNPLSHDQAISVVDDWLSQPMVRIATPTNRHWSILQDLIIHIGTAGNLTTDAHLAAIAIEKGACLYSMDNDFARFPNLKWANPLKLTPLAAPAR